MRLPFPLCVALVLFLFPLSLLAAPSPLPPPLSRSFASSRPATSLAGTGLSFPSWVAPQGGVYDARIRVCRPVVVLSTALPSRWSVLFSSVVTKQEASRKMILRVLWGLVAVGLIGLGLILLSIALERRRNAGIGNPETLALQHLLVIEGHLREVIPGMDEALTRAQWEREKAPFPFAIDPPLWVEPCGEGIVWLERTVQESPPSIEYRVKGTRDQSLTLEGCTLLKAFTFRNSEGYLESIHLGPDEGWHFGVARQDEDTRIVASLLEPHRFVGIVHSFFLRKSARDFQREELEGETWINRSQPFL